MLKTVQGVIIIIIVVVLDDDTSYWVYLSPDYPFQSAMVCNEKVRQLFYHKVRQVLLQSAIGITKGDNFITKCDDYYKVDRTE